MRVRSLKKIAAIALTAGLAMSVAACTTSSAPTGSEGEWNGSSKDVKDLVFATSVKVGGVGWFIRMEEGVKDFGADEGMKAFLQGPSTADVALQIKGAQDMLAQGIDALIVVPMEVPAMEPIMKQAMDSGVVVITQEASQVKNAAYDLEAFDNVAYGENVMKNLASQMGETGDYAAFVGSLNSTAQVEWMDAAVAYQVANYPDMHLVGDYNVSDSTQEKSYSQTKQLLAKYPSIKGFLGADGNDPVGIGTAVLEAGLKDQIAVMGTSLVSEAGELLKSGAVDKIFAWDPATAGYAANVVALRLIQGKTINDGDDLGVPGFEKIRLDGKVIYGNAWIEMTADNMGDYDF